MHKQDNIGYQQVCKQERGQQWKKTVGCAAVECCVEPLVRCWWNGMFLMQRTKQLWKNTPVSCWKTLMHVNTGVTFWELVWKLTLLILSLDFGMIVCQHQLSPLGQAPALGEVCQCSVSFG